MKEPPRGQFEKMGVLGEVITDTPPAAPSMEAAFERIMRIRTIKTVLIAFSAIGFGLFTVPVLGNLYLKQRFGLDAFQRGLIGTIGGLGVLVALPLVGRYYDKLFRRTRKRRCPSSARWSCRSPSWSRFNTPCRTPPCGP
jgi:hypothetical protein